jgi:hypothetical protein
VKTSALIKGVGLGPMESGLQFYPCATMLCGEGDGRLQQLAPNSAAAIRMVHHHFVEAGQNALHPEIVLQRYGTESDDSPLLDSTQIALRIRGESAFVSGVQALATERLIRPKLLQQEEDLLEIVCGTGANLHHGFARPPLFEVTNPRGALPEKKSITF